MPNKPREGTVRVTIRMDADVMDAIQADVEQEPEGSEIKDLSSWIRAAIQEKLKKLNQKKKKSI